MQIPPLHGWGRVVVKGGGYCSRSGGGSRGHSIGEQKGKEEGKGDKGKKERGIET